MGIKLILFFKVWDIRYLVNCLFYKLQGLKEGKWTNLLQMKNIAIRILYKLISQDFAPNTRAEILESFYNVWPWNKLKGPMFSVIKLEVCVNFFIGKVFQVLYFSSNAVVKTENLEEGFSRGFFSNFALPVIGNYDPISLQISCRK